MSQPTAAQIFASELEAASEMRACLLQEQSHLVRADVAALATIPVQKNALVQCLNLAASARMHALSASGHALTDAGMRDWLASLSDVIRQDWRTLMAVAFTTASLKM